MFNHSWDFLRHKPMSDYQLLFAVLIWVFTFSARMEGHHFIMPLCMDAAQGLKLFFKMVMVKSKWIDRLSVLYSIFLALLNLCHIYLDNIQFVPLLQQIIVSECNSWHVWYLTVEAKIT